MFGNDTLTPEMLMALGGGIMQGSNLGTGMGQGFQNAAVVMGQQKEQAAAKASENKTRAWLQSKYPGEDFSTMTPDMMKLYATETLKKQFSQADLPALAQEYNFAKQKGFPGSFMDYQKEKATLDSKPPADYQNYQMMQNDPRYADWVKQQQDAKNAPTSQDNFKTTLDTMKTYRGEDSVKTYTATRDAYEKVRTNAQLGTAQGDIGLVYGFMKMLDPTSVVREGEYATAQNSGGISDTVINLYNKVLNGERLTEDQRKQFVDAAAAQYENTVKNLETVNKRYSDLSNDYGVPTDRVLEQPKQYPALDLKPGEKVKTTVNGKPVTIERVPD